MSGSVLILRPQPAAEETAHRARSIGLDPVVAPLFRVEPVVWAPPDPSPYDAVMLTSANALRHAGDGLRAFVHLPAFAVGETTAAAAVDAGFSEVRTGPADAAALAALMAEQGVRAAFHPCGEDHVAPSGPGFGLDSVPVYRALAVDGLPPPARAALAHGALVLLHSPRAAALFDRLAGGLRPGTRIAALSPATATAAGQGWKAVAIADRPRDQALLELAAKLCQTGRE